MKENTVKNESLWHQFMRLSGGCVVDIDLSTHHMTFSPALIDALHLLPDTVPRTLEQWFELCHPDDYSKNLELSLFLKKAEAPFSVERRLYCGDGQYRRFKLDAFFADVGGVYANRLIGWERDISEGFDTERTLKNQKQELLELRGRLKEAEVRAEFLEKRWQEIQSERKKLSDRITVATAILDAIDVPICLWAEEGQMLMRNREFMRWLSRINDFEKQPSASQDEMRFSYDKWGREHLFQVKYVPINQRSGAVLGRVGIFHDETEKYEMEKDLERLRRKLGALVLRMPDTGEGKGEIAPPTDSNRWNLALLTLGRFLDTLSNADVFPSRTVQLRHLVSDAEKTELEVGVVGITSSGKSALINALMGEALLPEATRAISNVVVRCRKGEKRALTVINKEGERIQISGQELTPVTVEALASEHSESNRDSAYLEWSSPGAALPEGLVLVDTPGLDACGFPEHADLVLRRILPHLDIVLYVTSIRSRLKEADIELLKAVMEQDQRIIFILSQIDLEQDDVEGAQIVRSRHQKLLSYVKELQQDIASVSFAGSAVIPVSSKLALKHFYDRNAWGWATSNFTALVDQLQLYRDNLELFRQETRGRRILALTARLAADLHLALDSIDTDNAEAEVKKRQEKIRALKESQRWAHAEISAVRNEWRHHLDLGLRCRELERELGSVTTLQVLRTRYEGLKSKWDDLLARMTERMDRSRLLCCELLRKYGITSAERHLDWQKNLEDLPPFASYVREEPQEVRVRGWFEDMRFWPRQELKITQDLDREGMMEAVKFLLAERLRAMENHLGWWENWMRDEHCSPLFEEQKREEEAFVEIQRILSDSVLSRKTLRSTLQELCTAEHEIKTAMRTTEALNTDLIHADYSADIGRIAERKQLDEKKPVFETLLAAFREQGIQKRFLELKSVQKSRRVVLLGLRRHDGIALLSRLAHNIFWGDAGFAENRDGNEAAWLFCGTTPPTIPHVAYTPPDTVLRELEVLVAPDDIFCSNEGLDWHDLFAEWVPVVHLDLARIDSGLSDLARAPYFSALRWVDQWVLASGQGALFNGRLADLITDVPDRWEHFSVFNGYKNRPEWFIYENYDVRYSDFLFWGREVIEGLGEDLFFEKWLSQGYDFSAPFSEHRIRWVLESARRKKRTS